MKSYSNDIPNQDKVAEVAAQAAQVAAESEAAAKARHSTISAFVTVVIALQVANIAIGGIILAHILGFLS